MSSGLTTQVSPSGTRGRVPALLLWFRRSPAPGPSTGRVLRAEDARRDCFLEARLGLDWGGGDPRSRVRACSSSVSQALAAAGCARQVDRVRLRAAPGGLSAPLPWAPQAWPPRGAPVAPGGQHFWSVIGRLGSAEDTQGPEEWASRRLCPATGEGGVLLVRLGVCPENI